MSEGFIYSLIANSCLIYIFIDSQFLSHFLVGNLLLDLRCKRCFATNLKRQKITSPYLFKIAREKSCDFRHSRRDAQISRIKFRTLELSKASN